MINLILCGGAGTRLWPLSRNKAPKQFQPLFGGRSIFEETIERNRPFCERFVVASNAGQAELARRQLEGAGLKLDDGVIEPVHALQRPLSRQVMVPARHTPTPIAEAGPSKHRAVEPGAHAQPSSIEPLQLLSRPSQVSVDGVTASRHGPKSDVPSGLAMQVCEPLRHEPTPAVPDAPV